MLLKFVSNLKTANYIESLRIACRCSLLSSLCFISCIILKTFNKILTDCKFWCNKDNKLHCIEIIIMIYRVVLANNIYITLIYPRIYRPCKINCVALENHQLCVHCCAALYSIYILDECRMSSIQKKNLLLKLIFVAAAMFVFHSLSCWNIYYLLAW